MKQQPQILQFVRSARLFRLSPSSRSRHRLCCRTATSTHFWSSTIYTTFYYIHYISQRSNTKNCFRINVLQRRDSKPSADNNTRYSTSKSITECIKFTKRAELRTDFWQLDDIFEPPGRNELIVWKTCEGRALHSRKTLTPRFTDFFTDFTLERAIKPLSGELIERVTQIALIWGFKEGGSNENNIVCTSVFVPQHLNLPSYSRAPLLPNIRLSLPILRFGM